MSRKALTLFLVALAWLAVTVGSAFAEETVTITIPGDSGSGAETPSVSLATDDAGNWRASSATMTATFPAFSADAAVRVNATGHGDLTMATTRYLAIDATGRMIGEWLPNSAAAEASETSLTYRRVVPGIDEEFAVSADRVKHDAVLYVAPNLPATTSAFGFESRLVLPEGYTLSTTPVAGDSGRVATIAIVSPDGVTVYELPAVIASDANGTANTGWYEVTDNGNGNVDVRVMVASKWLSTAAFPVRIDPTISIPVTGGNYIPFSWVHTGSNGYNAGAVYQSAYPALNMQNTAGSITQMGIQLWTSAPATNVTFNRVVVLMGETTNASPVATFASNFNAAAAVTVFDGAYTINASGGGFGMVTLTTPFNYSGTNALLVEFRIYFGSSGVGDPIVATGSIANAWRNYAIGPTSTTATGSSPTFLTGAQFEIVVGPTITAPAGNTLPSQQAGTPVNISCTATGGTPPYTWSATGLPAGVSIDANSGAITGSASAQGTYNVDITCTDNAGQNDINSYTWVITAPPITLTTPAGNTIPEAYEGDAINLQFVATGGAAPYTFSAANLPAGVTMSAAGLLSGTLAAGSAGSHSIDVTVTDNNALSVVIVVTWEVFALPVASGAPTNATEGFAYSFAFTVTGGKAAFTWGISSTPALPAGLTFDTNTGTLNGTPASGDAGSYSLTVTVTDANGKSDDHDVTLVIDPEVSITLASLPAGTDTGNYGPVTVTTSGGVGPFVFGATGLPAGLSINPSTGDISGTIPANTSANSPFSVTLTVTDTNAFAAQAVLNLAVNVIPTLSVSTLPTGGLGTPYVGAQLSANGGTAPFTWQVTGLPQGLTANANGQISGNIAVTNPAGDYTVTITVTDANGVSNMVTATMKLIVVGSSISNRKNCGVVAGQSLPWYSLVLVLVVTMLAIRRRVA